METNPVDVAIPGCKAGRQADFAIEFPAAGNIISQSAGYLSHTLARCGVANNRYLLRVN